MRGSTSHGPTPGRGSAVGPWPVTPITIIGQGTTPVYVTIARLPCGHVTVCATAATADPPTLPDNAEAACTAPLCPPEQVDRTTGRSEEHTSELQSRPHLVCRLLLEKT